MKTYRHENTRYYWDFYLKFWVVYELDTDGNSLDPVEYFANKAQLLANYPLFKFIPE